MKTIFEISVLTSIIGGYCERGPVVASFLSPEDADRHCADWRNLDQAESLCRALGVSLHKSWNLGVSSRMVAA